jgi:RHS repeat-associated protein
VTHFCARASSRSRFAPILAAESQFSANPPQQTRKDGHYFAGQRVARRDISTNAVHYYFSDHLGSASVITDSNGNIQQESDYYPYGGEIVITSGDINHHKFTGKERDVESGLDNFGARYYSSVTGRFMSPDWAVKPVNVPYAKFGDPQTLNLFSYVENGPLNRIDADGHADYAEGSGTQTGVEVQSGGCSGANSNGEPCTSGAAVLQTGSQNTAQNIAEQIRSAGTISEHVGGDFDLGVRVTYDKNVPEMEPATKEYVEKVTLSAVGVDSVNISATTNGEHAPNSNHYNGTAVDINKVNGDRVINAGNDSSVSGHVSSIQNAANTPKNGVAHENYGPAGLWKDGRAINNPTLQAQHENHIHITIPRDDK